MTTSLLALAGPLKGQSFELSAQRITIGRHADNQIHIRQLSVSRHHCEILRDHEGFELHDLGTRHGTLVNDKAIQRHRLADGDLLAIGESVFRFQLTPDPRPSVPPGAAGAESAWNEASTVQLAPEAALRGATDRLRFALPSDPRLPVAFETLLEIGRVVQDARSTGEIGLKLLSSLMAVIPAERGAVLRVEKDGEIQTLATHRRSSAARDPFEASQTAVQRVLETGEGLLSNAVTDELRSSASLSAAKVTSLLCAPLCHRGDLLGILYLDSTCSSPSPSDLSKLDAGFDSHHLELVTAAAAVAAAAFLTARRVEWLEWERRRLGEELRHDLVGEGPAMARVKDLIARVGATDSTVLLCAESGCGKELVARALHSASPRSGEAFIAVNCATLSETLLESELFGHEKGAFTGATERRRGKFELADRGTLFLDEVGEIPMPLQARLLRALQEREIERLGGRGSFPIDVRVIAATNRDLRAEVANGSFRQDLFYRLDVIQIPIPPVRRRREDLPQLIQHFLSVHGRSLRRPELTLSPTARQALLRYDWPGNVRELANAMERAVVLASDDVIRLEDLPDSVLDGFEGAGPSGGDTYVEAVADFKRQLIRRHLDAVAGNVSRAAESLGVSRNYLHRLIRNLGLRGESSSVS